MIDTPFLQKNVQKKIAIQNPRENRENRAVSPSWKHILERDLLGEIIIFTDLSTLAQIRRTSRKMRDSINNLSQYYLKQVAALYNEDDRRHLAWHIDMNTPINMSKTFINDPSTNVLITAARNPNMPADGLVTLAKNPNDNVRRCVASNRSAPLHVLEHLTKDKNEIIRFCAERTLNTERTINDEPSMNYQ